MANQRLVFASFTTLVAFLCFILAAVALVLPIWAYFEDQRLGYDRGYFSPWKTCVYGLHRADRCGHNETHFKPALSVWLAGIAAYFGAATLALLCVLSVLQLAMINSREKLLLDYYLLIVLKLACSVLSAILSLMTIGLFSNQIGSQSERIFVSKGPAYYIQTLETILNLFLLCLTIHDVINSKKTNGDPTATTATINKIVTIGQYVKNGTSNGRSHSQIAMTRSSGRPYFIRKDPLVSSTPSIGSMSTMISNVSTVDSTAPLRSPLRSSLKKPSKNGFHNAAFNGSTNGLCYGANGHANGSTAGSGTSLANGIKKVRIQTHSTDV